MPDLGNFETAAHDGPLTFTIDGQPMQAMGAIPAKRFARFMEITSEISSAVARLQDKELPEAEQRAALDEYIIKSLDGFELVLDQPSLAIVRERIDSEENPLDVNALSNVFGRIAAFYSTGRTEAPVEEGADAAPFTGDKELPRTSDSTGTSSKETSSPEASTSTPEPETS